MPRPRKLVGETRDKAQQMLNDGVSRTRICQELQVDFHMLRREFGATCTKPRKSAPQGFDADAVSGEVN